MAATFQGSETKKEDFRRYLERSGVIDAMTKVLVSLYEEPEKPNNGLEFVKGVLGAPQGLDIESLRLENEELKQKNEGLETKVASLEEELAKLKQEAAAPPAEEGA
eukprot:Clim_evm155s147 gene=Clim_evmTU155s147